MGTSTNPDNYRRLIRNLRLGNHLKLKMFQPPIETQALAALLREEGIRCEIRPPGSSELPTRTQIAELASTHPKREERKERNMNNPNPQYHDTEAHYAPNPENDTLLEAIAACLREDGHHAEVIGKGSAAQITVTTHTNHIWTIDAQNGQAVIYPANIYVLEGKDGPPIWRVDLADPDMFTKTAKKMNESPT